MINEVNRACEKLNEALGISILLPNPGKKSIRAAAIRNFAVGAGLIAVGAAHSSKWCAVLGGAGVISGALLWKERRNREDAGP